MKRIICFILIVLTAASLAVSCGKIIPETAAFTRGTLSNNVYESTLAGVRFAPGPAWKFAQDAEILRLNGIGEDISGDSEKVEAALSERSTVYDMSAEDELSGVAVGITFENMSHYVGGDKTTVDEYVERLTGEIEKAYSDYEATVTVTGERSIAGDEYREVESKMIVGDLDVAQYYYLRKTGQFFVSISITAPVDYNVGDVLSVFEPIDG